MPSESFPVFVQQRGGERVRVGTASRESDGSFTLQLGDLTIGSQAEAAPAYGRPSAPAPLGPGGLPTVFPNYGRSKAAPIRGASQQDLEYYANGARRSLDDPSKERFHDKERALLAAIDQELARQAGGGGSAGEVSPFGGEEPPPPGDDDNIPF
jgi:hypothetical protein